MRDTLIQVQGLNSYYGASHILRNIDFNVKRGETIGLMGRNGMGKSTLLKSIMGIVTPRSGDVHIKGIRTNDRSIFEVAQQGIAYVPEGRGIFGNLSVVENLKMAARPGTQGQNDWTYDRVLETFPRLKERLGHGGQQLSGGEQQMLAMARILRSGARILLLDEITEGLAPVIVQTLGRVIRELKAKGLTIVLVEQNFRFAAPLADRHYVMEHGQIVATVHKNELDNKAQMLNEYLGV
jgi:branched-chain amino acid transport system ATP-binding protein